MKRIVITLIALSLALAFVPSAEACHGRRPGKRLLRGGKAVVRFILPGR